MEKYETVLILSPNLGEQQIDDLLSSLEQSIRETEGNHIHTDRWGERTLAYPVKKVEEGFYALLFYEAGGETIKELERRMRMNENVIKFLTVQSKTDKPGRPSDMDAYSFRAVSSHNKHDASSNNKQDASSGGKQDASSNRNKNASDHP